MPAHVFYGYSADVFAIDPETGDATVSEDYTPRDRVRFEIQDNDSRADGDNTNDEIGDDADQQGVVTDTAGNEVGSGRIYVEEVRWYQSGDGEMVAVNGFEIDGEVVGYMPSAPFDPGQSYSFVGTSESGQKIGGQNNNNSRSQYSEHERNSLDCFGPGTMISTLNGDIPVEWLETSDKVLTRDHGYQTILWIGRTTLPPGHFDRFADDAPLCIPAGTLGSDRPTHDLHVTGNHRVLIRSVLAELAFLNNEVFAPAKAWRDAGLAHPVRPQGSYTVSHILFDRHQVIRAQGTWVESMFTGREALRRLRSEDRARIEDLVGPGLNQWETARHCLTRREAAMLIKQTMRPTANREPTLLRRRA